MNKIYKVNSNKSDKHICSYCYSYIKSTRCKSLFINNTQIQNLNKYTICNICNRFINEINNGPNIIDYIVQNKSKNNLLLNIARYKIWYFNDIYDNFGIYLHDRFKFTHNEIKNIYQAIYKLNALPNINIINEKALYIYHDS